MKCDELKPLMCAHNPNVRPMYDKYLVDEAIAELKQALHDAEMAKDDAEAANTEYRLDIEKLKDKIQMHDFFWEGNGFDKMEFKNTIQVREYIDKLKAENAELKFKLKKINDNFAIKAKLVYERHERHTLRELWLARAERADTEACLYAERYGLGDDRYIRWFNAWKALIKKAEEFK